MSARDVRDARVALLILTIACLVGIASLLAGIVLAFQDFDNKGGMILGSWLGGLFLMWFLRLIAHRYWRRAHA